MTGWTAIILSPLAGEENHCSLPKLGGAERGTNTMASLERAEMVALVEVSTRLVARGRVVSMAQWYALSPTPLPGVVGGVMLRCHREVDLHGLGAIAAIRRHW